MYIHTLSKRVSKQTVYTYIIITTALESLFLCSKLLSILGFVYLQLAVAVSALGPSLIVFRESGALRSIHKVGVGV